MNRCRVVQHEPVAAERDDHVGVVGLGIAITANQALLRALRFRHVAGDKGDVLVARFGGTLGHSG